MTVERWISFEKAVKLADCGIGGIGEWADGSGRWADYVAGFDDAVRPYLEALRASIVQRGIRSGGNWHQGARDGCPLFSDGTTACFGLRAWGGLLACIWAENDGRDYSYTDFYWT